MTIVAIAAGSNVSVPVPAGSQLRLSGQGRYRIGPQGTSARPTVDELLDEFASIGPYEQACTVIVWADRASTYDVVAPSDVTTPGGLTLPGAPLAALVSGAGRRVVYTYGDSIPARSTREDTFSAGTFVFTPGGGGYMVPTPTPIGPSGSRIRVYGFADPRMNFDSVVTFVSGQPRIPLPSNIDYTGAGTDISNWPAAPGQARAMNNEVFTDQSIIAWAQAASGKRYDFVNLAQGGITSTAALALLPGKLAGLTPGIFIIGGFLNTAKNGETNATVLANLRQMITLAKAAFHSVLVFTPTTFGSALASYATFNVQMLAQHAGTKALCEELDVPYLDAMELWLDGASADGQPKAGYTTTDGIHWRAPMVQRVGAALAPVLDSLGASSRPAPVLLSALDGKYNQAGTLQNADHPNVLRNGQLLGTGGTASLPDGFTHTLTATPTVVYTKEASRVSASDGKLVVTYSGNAGSNVAILSASCHADLTPGKVVFVTGEIEIPAALSGVRIAFGLNLDSSGGTGEAGRTVGIVSLEQADWPAGIYRFPSMEWTVPAGVAYTAARVLLQIVATTTQTNTVVKTQGWQVVAR